MTRFVKHNCHIKIMCLLQPHELVNPHFFGPYRCIRMASAAQAFPVPLQKPAALRSLSLSGTVARLYPAPPRKPAARAFPAQSRAHRPPPRKPAVRDFLAPSRARRSPSQEPFQRKPAALRHATMAGAVVEARHPAAAQLDVFPCLWMSSRQLNDRARCILAAWWPPGCLLFDGIFELPMNASSQRSAAASRCILTGGRLFSNASSPSLRGAAGLERE